MFAFLIMSVCFFFSVQTLKHTKKRGRCVDRKQSGIKSVLKLVQEAALVQKITCQ